MQTEVAIIGAGPAGMATALQLKRSGIEFLLFEKDKPAGLLKNAWRVENYLGFAKGKSGFELLQLFQQHLTNHAIKPIIAAIEGINYKNNRFVITTNKSIYYVKYLVVASGTKPKQDDLLSKNNKVLYEIFPVLKKQGKTIAIIGAGDAAFDFALNVAAQNKVFVINRNNAIKALPLLIDKALQHQNITYKENYILQQIISGKDKDLLLTFNNNQDCFELEVDYLVAAIGRVPQKDFYTEKLLKVEQQLVSKGLLYLVGDVEGQIYRQVAIATASGIKAAMQICEQLRDIKLCK